MPYENFVYNSKEMPDLSDYMTTKEAAEKLGFTSTTAIRHLVYKGKIESLKFDRTVMIKRSSVDAYLEKTQGMQKNDPRRR